VGASDPAAPRRPEHQPSENEHAGNGEVETVDRIEGADRETAEQELFPVPESGSDQRTTQRDLEGERDRKQRERRR
jgi:hypothetical protein